MAYNVKFLIKTLIVLLKMKENFKIPKDIEPEAKEYIQNVLDTLEENDVMEEVDSAALTMLARNYSMFIKANKLIEKEGITVVSDRGNISAHPAVGIAKDAQVQAMKVMAEFGLTAKARTKIPQFDSSTSDETPIEQIIKSKRKSKKEVR